MKISATDNERIIKLLRNAETRAGGFELLVHCYSGQVYRHIRRMVIDHDSANDLTQDVFVKIWESLPGFRYQSELSTWVYRISVNTALSYLRRLKIAGMISLTPIENKMKNMLAGDNFYTGDEVETRFQNALMALPPRQRSVFMLRYYDEMSFEDIASVFGKSPGAMKASYHHAQQKVKDFLCSV